MSIMTTVVLNEKIKEWKDKQSKDFNFSKLIRDLLEEYIKKEEMGNKND